jgi:uncharacterized protein
MAGVRKSRAGAMRHLYLMPFRRQQRMATMPSHEPMGPTDPGARLEAVDAVRGFALFGVLLVNMYNFGAYSPEWTGALDRFCFAMMHAVFETKSWRLFAMLFGFGFALQMSKSVALGGGKLWFYYRRIAILFIIGMAHALFYDGDILMEYALLGFILPAFRRLPSGVLLILAFVLMSAFPVGKAMHSLHDTLPQVDDDASLTLAELREDHPYLGSLGEIFETNAEVIPPRPWEGLHGPESALAIFAMVLLGFLVGRSRLVHDAAGNTPAWGRVFRWGMGIGVTFAVCEWVLGHYHGYEPFEGSTASPGIQFVGDVLFAYGSTALALAYGSGIVLLAQRGTWSTVLRPLQYLGRMALTVYLSGTLMFTILFYGYGFGQIYLLGPAATTAWAILFFAIQAVFSAWWLRFFRFGPMEWIWRSLTYLRMQPLRISGAR